MVYDHGTKSPVSDHGYKPGMLFGMVCCICTSMGVIEPML
jgi:hypothetical protein